MNITCSSCGAEMPSEALFCDRCGSRLPRREQGVAPAAPTATPAVRTCPRCGSAIQPGEGFCTRCGLQLGALPEARPARQEQVVSLLMANNMAINLPIQAEVIIGREDSLTDTFPDIDLTPYGASEQGVSRRHARIITDGSQYFIEDLESTNYTFVNQERVKPGERRPLQPGDQVRFGRVAATFQITRPA